MRNTKIVCTIGPASDNIEVMKKLLEAGMNVARLNFSHGTHEEHAVRIEKLRRAAGEAGRPLAIILDTKGPEVRTGGLKDQTVELKAGQNLLLVTRDQPGDASQVSVSYPGLPGDVKPGDTILLDDGLIALEVLSTGENEINCRVMNGGILGEHKGVNVPGVEINLPAVTDKDRADLLFAVEHDLDYIAASFMRTPADVHDVRRVLEEQGSNIPIIAKIESRAGVSNLEEILQVADGIMVARGDLGVEIPPEEVPLVQKRIIRACNLAGKPVITATQMLDSMIRNPRPTRAEASDVANAIFDGTDAVMLSGETASGKYPLEAAQTMSRIALAAENDFNFTGRTGTYGELPQTVTDSISQASCAIALELQAAAIITPTSSGSTARMVSKYRPKAPIIAVTPYPKVQRSLCLVWGVEPILVEEKQGTDEILNAAVAAALTQGLIKSGEMVILTAGLPGVPGTTNLLKVHTVSKVLARGTGTGTSTATGRVKVVKNMEDLEGVLPGEVLVVQSTGRESVPAMQRAAAVITVEGGLTSHAAVVGLSLGLPVVVGVEEAFERLPEGTMVTVDGKLGLIYLGEARIL